ncbi:MAG: hypothetical protein IPM53_24065 [Anaerolineaceae bacterium]|nr:hypothetical protein [Anaerolineaceae bacterium]
MPPLPRKRLIWITILLVMLLAGWLYWPTLRLPLIYDTLLHIRIAGDLTWSQVWLPIDAFGFYRPMTFFPMLVIRSLFGGYPAWLLHGNNVLQHAVNAGLLAWLSWRLWPDWRRAVAAGSILAVFPFSYQAVAIYGHNVHPAITGLVLLGLHTYLTAVSHQKAGTQSAAAKHPTTEKGEKKSEQSAKSADKKIRKWLFLTWLLFSVMVLTHETAVLFGGLAALVHICAQPELLTRWRQLLRQPWRWYLLAGVAYLVIYQFLPISRAPQAAEAGRDLWLNGLYLLQAAVFPIAWFAHLLPTISGQLITGTGVGLVLAASGWLAWRKPAWRAPLLLAWGWWGAASLLLAITLPTDYLLRGPRLLYLGSVGVALLWAQLLAGVWTLTPVLPLKGEGVTSLPRPARGLIWTAVLLFILFTSGQFVRTKLDEYARLTRPVEVLNGAVHPRISGPEDEIVLLNLPQWLDVPPNTYAIGVEFVAMLGDYLFAEELVAANLPGQHPVWAVSLPELQTSQSYAYAVHAQHEWPALFSGQTRHFFITSYLPDGPHTRYTGHILPGYSLPIPPPNPIANLGGYQLTSATAEACDAQISVWLRWLAGADAVPETTSVFVQVLGEDGRLLTQADGPPLGIRPGLLNAPTDSLLYDRREMTLPVEETAVPTTLLVGAYDFASGVRQPASDVLGQPLPDDAWQVPIVPCGE